MRPWMRRFAVACAALVLGVDCLPGVRTLLQLPGVITVAVGQSEQVRLGLPGMLAVHLSSGQGALSIGAAATGGWMTLRSGRLTLRAGRPGRYVLNMRVLGVLPWRSVVVDAVSVPDVVPGGQSVGLVLRSRCALVAGVRPAGLSFPWRPSSGLVTGDCILSVDGHPVPNVAVLAQQVQAAGASGQDVMLRVKRGQGVQQLAVHPTYRDGRYQLGVQLQTGTSGIGTLTFHTASGVFAALGHEVAFGPGVPVTLGEGQLMPSLIAGMDPSTRGDPGEKVGIMLGGPPVGQILANTSLGVFGRLLGSLPAGLEDHPVPVALENQVHPGPATLLTVVAGNTVQAFSMEITSVSPQRAAEPEGFTIHITDPALLARTGGIVQGMSGSPVLQDGRLVGAITHVFIHDPTRGYGVLAVWMAEEAGIITPITHAALANAV